MEKKDIKTLEDANKYISELEKAAAADKKEAQKIVDQLTKDLATANKGKVDAEEAANDAIAKLEELIGKAPKEYTANVKGIGKVRVNFGADGISKDDLLNNHAKIKELHDKGSNAITKVEEGK